MKTRPLAFALLLLPFTAALEIHADDVKMRSLLPFGPAIRQERRFPVAFLVENEGPEVRGQLRVVQQEFGVKIVARNVVLPPHSATRHFLYPECHALGRAQPLVAQLISQEGKHVTADLEIPTKLLYADISIGVIVREDVGLGDFAAHRDLYRSRGSRPLVASLRCKPEFLPDRWKGYDILDALIWPNPHPNDLSPSQQRAIETWVRAGGRLCVSLGSDWSAIRGSFLEELLPGKVIGRTAIPAPESIAKFCGANRPEGLIAVCQLDGVQGDVLCKEGDLPLVVQAKRDFGVASLLTFDATRPPLVKWGGMARLWRRILAIPEKRAQTTAFRERPAIYPSAEIQRYLADIAVLSSISLAWIIWVVVIYILLVGPADYFVLKRFNRLRWTWITFPTLVALFSTVAFWRSYSAKGGDMILRRLSIVDVSPDSGLAKGEEFFLVFSPQNTRYDIAHSEPSAFAYPWEGSSRKVGRGLSHRKEVQIVQNRGTEIKDIPINKWSTEEFRLSWIQETNMIKPIQADLTYDGARVRGEVANNSGYDFEEAFIIRGTAITKLGRFCKGQSTLLGGGGGSLSSFLRSSTFSQYSRAGQADDKNTALRKGTRLALLLSFPENFTVDLSGDYSTLCLTDELEKGKAIFIGLTKQQPADIIVEGWKPKEMGICALRIVLE